MMINPHLKNGGSWNQHIENGGNKDFQGNYVEWLKSNSKAGPLGQ